MNEPLAIVGMACRLPGADGLDAFWKLVVERGTAWGVLPESRLSRDLYFDAEKGRVGKSYSEMGAVVSDRPVDRRVCPLTADMADRYDIAHHIFLEVASLACRDAGMDPFAMPAGRRTGVYVGHTGGSTRIGDIVYSTGIDEAASLLGEVEAARAVLGDAVDEVAAQVTDAVRRRYPGRRPGQKLDLGAIGAAQIVQEALRLDGPYLVVDAACASSLQAMAIGARALLQGGIDQAIVGGASYCKSDSLVLFSAAQSVSNSGSCPFGEAADGLITAEGYVALVIKTLSRAIADGDRIRAVIRGLGVASDGKGKSLWAPRQEGQVLAVQRAYPDPADLGRIEYIEAHATSTQVGDATELSALSRLLRPHVPAGRTIPIGSVKANIGHTLETAGIASLVKVVLAMEHGAIPPGSTCQELNSEFDWQSGPFSVPREPIAWPPHADGSPRLAAVNAFGIGGLNVHVALAEHVPATAMRSGARPAARPSADDGAIAIVGAGCVLPGALSLEAFLARIGRGESAIGPVPADRWQAGRALDRSAPRSWHTLADRGGFVRDFAYDWRRHKVPPKQIAAANPLQFMLLEAADAAIADAGGPNAGLDRTRTGVVVGTLFGGDFANQLQIGLRLPETGRDLRAALARRGVAPSDIDRIVEAYEKKVLERMPALIDETGSFTSSTLASRLTKTFDLMGGALALDAGDCSSVSALSAAADMLREGACDAVLCAAGQRSLDLMTFEGLSLLGKLQPSSGSKPGDVVPGEGAVVFVLKRLGDAVAAGNRIRGVIRAAQVQSVAAAIDVDPPSLAGVIGHTGAAAAAAELLALLDRGASGTIAISGGGLAGRIDVGDAAVATPAAARATPAPVEAPARAPAPLAGRPLVAALFPGQGSQYADMFRGLAAESAEARDALARLDAMARSLGHETLAEIAWRPDNGLGTRIWDTQWAMYLGDLFAWEVLRGMGFAPDVVASHSFGEFPALAAAGAWSVEDGARATRARADAVEAHGPRDGAMLSVIADRGTVQSAIEPFAGQVWVCAENAPEQFVIGGTARVVDAVEVLIESRRVKSKRLAVPSPFHTPLLQRSADQLATTIAALAIKPPATPIFSSTTVSKMADPAAVRESLVRQMTETVRWIGVVEELYAAGVRTFVEVGPSGVLTGLARRILEGRAGCTFLQFDQRGRAAAEHLARLREQLSQAGAIRAQEPARKKPQPARGAVVSFDATARRRERNRAGTSQRVTPREPVATASKVAKQPLAAAAGGVHNGSSHAHGNGNGNGHGNGDWERSASAMLVAERPVAAKPAAARVEAPVSPPPGPRDSGNEIETFLIDFVVEQTGYPREIVELDADLEADLGIDSIRKAQLFGEIGQKYGLKADDSVSLDEFPTLRHLLDYLLPRVGAVAATTVAKPSQPAAVPQGSGHAANGHGGNGHSGNGHAAHAAHASAARAVAVDAPATDDRSLELETFLIDFVVEQTGYPREIVELDADLEADLGIDSIRKAQLFGEIGQKYSLKADDSVSLDEFPTLRHLLDYMLPRVGAGSAASAAANSQPAAAPPANGHAANGQTAPAPAARSARVAEPATGDRSLELETFLIDFVVEQTGYPREIVELDADLEADLGIDSIRKAQLFGEIGQKYSLKADDSLSLDEFPTLRHLLAYMLPRIGGTATASAAAGSPATSQPVREEPAIVDLAAALGGFDAVLVAPADPSAPRGLIACFGRHASPAVRRVEAGGVRATLVGAEGLPGALVGWNDAGLIVFAAGATGRDGMAATAAVEEIVTTCRSAADAEGLIGGPSRPHGLVVAHVSGGGSPPGAARDPKSALERVALADGAIDGPQALAALLSRQETAARDALSAACAWLACGVSESGATAVSGGPFAGEWLGSDAAISGPAWSPASSGEITRRYSIALREIGSPRIARNLAGERVMLLGGGGLADALAEALHARGAVAVRVKCGSVEEVIALVERAEEDGAVRHLIVAARPQQAGDKWTGRRNEAIVAPFFACQRWITMRGKAGDIPSSTLTAVVDLGGDFGISGAIGAVEGGGLAGLFKGIAREFPALHVRVVDASQAVAPAQLAAAVVAEIQDAAGPVEIGLLNGRRVTVVPCEQRPQSGQPLGALARGSVWIVTGGARGVTAECARALGRKHGLVLALVGSTQPVAVDPSWLALDETGLKDLKGRVMLDARGQGTDPRSAWRTVEKSIEIEKSLARFREAGVAARYFACDLADEAAVKSLVQRVARELGPVRGVLHGAGFESACRFEKKTLEGLAATLGPKCAGIEHLLATIDPATLEAVIGFGSTSGRLGGHGQADYSLANDMLAKILGARRRSGLRTTVFHWHAWDEVGMASRPESRFVLEQFGLKFMPLAEGVRRFMDELEAGLPDAEVLVTEPACVPDAVVVAADSVAASPATAFIAGIERSGETTKAFVSLDPSQDRFLLDHRQHGKPILPAVIGAQLLFEAAKAAGADAGLGELRQFLVHRPVSFPTSAPRQLRFEVRRLADGSFKAEAFCAVTNAQGVNADSERVHFEGQLVTGRPTADVPAFEPPPLPFYPTTYPENSPLWHGAAFRTLTGLFLDRSGGWGSLVAPDPATLAAPRRADGWSVPAALLDGCLMACGIYSFVMCGKRLEIPRRFDRLRLLAAPSVGEACTVRLRFIGQDATETTYDLVVYGADGRPLVALDGLRMAVMS